MDSPTDPRDVYADLIAHGVPLVLCTPHRHRANCRPDCGRELDQAKGWEHAEPDLGIIDGYRPGLHTVAMVTGHALDCIDLDPKNGCDLDATVQRVAACGVTVLGCDVTPSGGLHLFVMASGIRSTTSSAVGIDFCGGGRIGGATADLGRHLVYLPGANRPKYPGKDYAVVSPVDWEALAELDEGDERDALWTFLSGVGLTPRLEPAAVGDVVAEGDIPEHLPDTLTVLLTDAGPTWETVKGTSSDRSERFHHLVKACQREGLTQAETVAVLRPWCEAVGRYIGRIDVEVARSWGKPDRLTEWAERQADATAAPVTTSETTAASAPESAAVPPDVGDQPPPLRRLVLTSAADIEPLPTTWTWDKRLPTGALGLIAGPEGTGKSTCAYWTVARITRGELPGIHHRTPKDVLIAATEDSWARTIVPRLIAAGADLGRVWRVEVTTALGTGGYLTLPKDIGQLAEHVRETGAALLLLDPIMSRLEAGLDTHKDAETRRALEPIASLAERTGMSVLGLIHFNKGGSADVLNNVMASKAFTAVARSVSTVIRDPNDDTGRTRIFGTPKSNLGRDDLPLLPFQLAEHTFRNRAGDLIVTSRIEWLAERIGSMDDLMRQARDSGTDRSIVTEVAEWLTEYLHTEGGSAKRSQIIDAARKERYSEDQLKRAADRLGLVKQRKGFPASSWWMTPDDSAAPPEDPPEHSQSTVRASVRGESLTTLTTPTGDQSAQLEQLAQSEEPPELCANCAGCGKPLLLQLPGRDTCARCAPVVATADNLVPLTSKETA